MTTAANVLSGVDILIISASAGSAIDRCLRSIETQHRMPRQVAVLSFDGTSHSAPGDSLEFADPADLTRWTSVNGAPWILVMSSGDVLSPDALLALEAFSDGAAEEAYAISLVHGSGVEARDYPTESRWGQRVFARRGWSGWGSLATSVARWSLASAIGSPDMAGKLKTLAVSERLVTPAGDLDHRGRFEVGAKCRGALDPLDVSVRHAGRGALDGDAVRFDVASVCSEWTMLVAPGMESVTATRDFQRKAALRVWAGAEALVFVAAGETQPNWQQVYLPPGALAQVVGLLARTEDLRAVASEQGAGALEAMLATVAGRSAGAWSMHAVRTDAPEAFSLVVPCGRPAPTAVGSSVGPPGSSSASRPCRSYRIWAPGHVVALELAVDPAFPESPLLATELAPLPPCYSARVTIGGVEALPLPGSEPIFRTCNGADVVYSRHEGSELLGYAPAIPLVDMGSLWDRWLLGRDWLRRELGASVPGWPPDTLLACAIYHRPSVLVAGRLDAEWPTVVVETPRGPMVGRHPDLLPWARSAGLVARIGPALAMRPSVDRTPIEGVGGVCGYGRLQPAGADASLPIDGGRWYGRAPDPRAVPLILWESHGEHRLTTGEVPLVASRGRFRPDTHASLVGTLGWVRAAGSGAQPLWELYHPGYQRWAYSTHPPAEIAHGYVAQRVIAETHVARTERGVSLFRSYDSLSGLHRLSMVPSANGLPLYGWVEIVDLGESLDPQPPPGSPDRWLREPRPGFWPVIRMGDGKGDFVHTTEPSRYLEKGWASYEVSGYVVPARSEVDHLGATTALRSVPSLELVARHSAIAQRTRPKLARVLRAAGSRVKASRA